MPMEMRPLTKRLGLQKGEVGGLKVRTGTLDGEPVVGYVTGMGPDLATKGIDRLLEAVRPERVVVFGITGAVENETPIGTVMMPALVIDHATGRTHEHRPPAGEATKGALWTTNIMTPPSELPGLIEQGVIALDMETAAFAQSCERDGVAWSVHRAISDHPKDDIDDEVFGLYNLDATPNWGNIARYVVRHPIRTLGMVKLAKNGKLATENAADAAIAAARAARQAPA
jgi:nucleoside phosphorylase